MPVPTLIAASRLLGQRPCASAAGREARERCSSRSLSGWTLHNPRNAGNHSADFGAEASPTPCLWDGR